MSNSEHAFSVSLYIISFIVGGIGLVIGMLLFLLNGSDVGIVLIMIGIIGAIIIFALGKIVQMLHDVSLKGEVPIPSQVEKVKSEDLSEKDVKISTTLKEEWVLKDEEQQNIMNFYEKKDQRVEEIILTPYPKYCIVKAEDFIDVIELRGNEPKTLTRDEVAKFKDLQIWIEEKIFGM